MSDFRISQVAASPSMTEPSTSGSERKLDRPAVVLGARSICKSFGRRAAAHQVLFDVDVDVYEGECLAVIGGSGSGKSTLTRIMLGLENADGGTVEYRGTPVLRGGSGLKRRTRHRRTGCKTAFRSRPTRWPNCDGSLRSWELRACKPCGR